jgi:chromosome segregation ATPase
MNQPPNEDTTWMIEVQTERIIQLESQLEAAQQRIGVLEGELQVANELIATRERMIDNHKRMNHDLQCVIDSYNHRLVYANDRNANFEKCINAICESVVKVREKHKMELDAANSKIDTLYKIIEDAGNYSHCIDEVINDLKEKYNAPN